MPTLATEDGLPEILGPVPAAVEAELADLRAALDKKIPAKKVGKNVLVGTWNVRAFGDMSETWERGKKDSPKRNMADVLAIAEIVSRFDVVAIQESRANLKALRHMLKALGPEWGLILTDVNPPPAGNGERLAFVFDTRRVQASGLAAELVVPDEWLQKGEIAEGALREQFVRTPYAVSFLAGSQTFILTTLHVIYGEDAEDRTGELQGDCRVAGQLGEADLGGLQPEPDHPRRPQRRPRRRPQLRSAHLHRPTAAGRAEDAAADDLRHRRRPPLLRPDRLVHGEGRRPARRSATTAPGTPTASTGPATC